MESCLPTKGKPNSQAPLICLLIWWPETLTLSMCLVQESRRTILYDCFKLWRNHTLVLMCTVGSAGRLLWLREANEPCFITASQLDASHKTNNDCEISSLQLRTEVTLGDLAFRTTPPTHIWVA